MAEPVVAVRGIPQSQYNEQLQTGIAPGQGAGKFSLKDSIKRHPTAWALGGAGVLVFLGIIVYMYNQNKSSGVTSADTTGLSTTDTSGISTTDQGVPYQNTGAIADQSAVLQAIAQEQTGINQILANMNGQSSNQTATQTGSNPTSSQSAGTTATQPTTPVANPSWSSQNTAGENQAQIEKAYQGCISNCESTSIECKGKKKGTQSCTSWCQQKCAARHPLSTGSGMGGGYLDGSPTSRFIIPSSSLSHQSMYYHPPIYGDAMSRIHYKHLRMEDI